MNNQNNKQIYKVKGVAVDKYIPAQPQDKSAIVMVHGGNHGSWCWGKWANFLCEAGYEVHALNWYNHGDSDELPQDEFIKRSITDIARKEMTYIIGQFDRPPIVIGHSMGGLAGAVYAAAAPLEKLVLVAPVLPAVAHAEPIPLTVDPSQPFPVMPYPQAKELFYTTLDDAEAQRYIAKLVPESAQAVIETTTWAVDLDPGDIKVPVFAVGAELDRLIPLEPLRRYAQLLHAEYNEMSGVGHCDVLLKEPNWRDAVRAVQQWL